MGKWDTYINLAHKQPPVVHGHWLKSSSIFWLAVQPLPISANDHNTQGGNLTPPPLPRPQATPAEYKVIMAGIYSMYTSEKHVGPCCFFPLCLSHYLPPYITSASPSSISTDKLLLIIVQIPFRVGYAQMSRKVASKASV